MNHIHRLVFNASTNTWTAVAENARGRGKGSSRKLIAASLSLTVSLAQAALLGGTVASGAGSISQAGSATTILQTTPSLTLNWKSFNIGAAESVKFVQPSAISVAVNRIHDTQGSQILGRLSANGQVYLINPNGILFGPNAQVNVAGLHASTQTLNNTGTGSATPYGPGSITNHGTLTALNGGFVTLQADTVTNTGLISAQTVGTESGRILLLGNMRGGTVNVGGTLDASAPNGGNGGFIDTSAASVKIGNAAQVTTFAINGTTGTWLIDPPDFTIAATGGDMTGLQLSTLLNKNSIQILSSAGKVNTAGNGDINVNDVVSWSANTLTLTADNNININAHMAGSGTAKLALEYGQGKTIPTATNINTSEVYVKAPVDLPAGWNFSSKWGSNGAVRDYMVITSLGKFDSVTGSDLQGMQSFMSRNYVLGSHIDANPTANWNGGLGFLPIPMFDGWFDGLGHVITGLTIRRLSEENGLFGAVGSFADLRNVGFTGGSISGAAGTGGLVGTNSTGNITNSFNTGTVVGTAGTGGLVGRSTTGNITNSYATGNVTGTAGTGGLVGTMTTGALDNNYATGNVVGTAGTGGLIGVIVTGNISNSYAEGNVTGTAATGGLAGSKGVSIAKNTHALGKVSGTANVGGLVGVSSGPVIDSYAEGAVTGIVSVGGLVGATAAEIDSSHALGKVSGTVNVGGLVGVSTAGVAIPAVSKSYATGDVVATGTATATGGLAGFITGSIENSYAWGNVLGVVAVGGLAGVSTGKIFHSYTAGAVNGNVSSAGGLTGSSTGVITESFWNTDLNSATQPSIGGAPPATRAIGDNVSTTGSKGLTTMEQAAQSNFAVWDFSSIWMMPAGGGSPVLIPKIKPTTPPTAAPTSAPTGAPTAAPTSVPTGAPTAAPTSAPTGAPTAAPTSAPTGAPTAAPTSAPTAAPTSAPTAAPTSAPTGAPTPAPTAAPSASPSSEPAAAPTAAPTTAPTMAPTVTPTAAPTTETVTVQTRAGANSDLNCRSANGSTLFARSAKVMANKEKGLPDSTYCAVENAPLPTPASASASSLRAKRGNP